MHVHRVTFKQSRKESGNIGVYMEAKPTPGSENQAGSKVQFDVMQNRCTFCKNVQDRLFALWKKGDPPSRAARASVE